jgi:hypothetical protein
VRIAPSHQIRSSILCCSNPFSPPEPIGPFQAKFKGYSVPFFRSSADIAIETFNIRQRPSPSLYPTLMPIDIAFESLRVQIRRKNVKHTKGQVLQGNENHNQDAELKPCNGASNKDQAR